MTQSGVMLYDFLFCKGGAEHTTLTVGYGLPDAEVCVGFVDHSDFGVGVLDGVKVRELMASPRVSARAWRTVSGIWAFRRRAGFIRTYDWAVFSGSNAPVAVRHRPPGRNIYYCHTVPRFAYDLNSWYRHNLPIWQRPAMDLLACYVRHHYERALRHMDRIVVNSGNVQSRLKKYLGVDSEVVYPPCDTAGYKWLADGDYYVSTARLETFKRVDVIVEAFRRMPERKLVVASGGAAESELRKLAQGCENILFTGWLSTAEMQKLIGGALATIYIPRDEDFGMSPVESMAAGKPVIGVAEGGVCETVVDGETGVLVPPDPDAEAVMSGVERLRPEDARAMRAACEHRAEGFGRERFLNRMREIIDSTAPHPSRAD